MTEEAQVPPAAGGDTGVRRPLPATQRLICSITAKLKAAFGCGKKGGEAAVRDQEALLGPGDVAAVAADNRQETNAEHPGGLWSDVRFWRWSALLCLIMIMITVTVLNLLHLTFVPQVSSKEPPLLEPCPDDWMYYRRTCYYFSEFESDWVSSQNYCSEMGASLALIRNQEELNFVYDRMWNNPPWIGLHRTEGEMQWVNHIPFNINLFELQDSGDCAYVNSSTIYLSECGEKKSFACTMGRSCLESNLER